ncbi:MAG: DUF4255 domain-containing protein [Phototrophicaceae bacterium]
MIADLDQTLEAMLRRDLPDSITQQVTISFAPPDGNFPPQSVSLPAIDLFLYDIRENREVRSTARRVIRDNGNATIYPAPVRVDCSYLITAWASDATPRPMEDEHQLLGHVMMVLLRNKEISDDLLRGYLIGKTPEISTSVLQSGHLQSIGEFWQALGGKPKAALNYTVTISVEPTEPIEAPLVGRSRIDGRLDADEESVE